VRKQSLFCSVVYFSSLRVVGREAAVQSARQAPEQSSADKSLWWHGMCLARVGFYNFYYKDYRILLTIYILQIQTFTTESKNVW